MYWYICMHATHSLWLRIWISVACKLVLYIYENEYHNWAANIVFHRQAESICYFCLYNYIRFGWFEFIYRLLHFYYFPIFCFLLSLSLSPFLYSNRFSFSGISLQTTAADISRFWFFFLYVYHNYSNFDGSWVILIIKTKVHAAWYQQFGKKNTVHHSITSSVRLFI